MSSPQLHNHLSAGQPNLATRVRRSAIAIAIAAAVATGSAALVTSAGHTPDATAQLNAGPAMQSLHVGATSASFVRRIRTLEAAGYVNVACAVHGDLMLNPRRHRYVTVRA